MGVAADVTVVDSAHLSLTGGVAQTVRLTGAGKYLDVVGHLGVEWTKIFFTVADSEADLVTVTVDGDDVNVAGYPHRVRVPVTRDVWVRVLAEFDTEVSLVKNSIPFMPDRFRDATTPVYFTLDSNTLGVLDQNRLG